MTRPLPTPLAAAIGLVPTVLGGVRSLPGRVVQLPVLAVSGALSTLDSTRRGYDDLADRGERLIARLRGVSLDEVEDRVEGALQGTPVAGLYDRVEDTLEDAAEAGGRAVRSLADGAGGAAAAAGSAAGAVEDAAGATTTTAQEAAEAPEAEQPKGRPTPRATQPDDTRIGTAATPDVVETVERVAAGTGGRVLEHDELPLADYDHMTLGSLRGRMRALTVEQLVQLRDYEKAHADRLPVVTMLDNRIAKLSNDPSAAPTGNAEAPVPELQPSQIGQGGSKVSPATSGPKMNPPSQGVPTNPAQPRSTG